VFVAKAFEGQRYFILQYRAADPDVVVTSNSVALISLVVQVGISFCPWCGVRLLDHYHNRLDELERPELAVPVG
jgi:hypothetical protein